SQLNQIINLQASSIWSKKKGIKGFISMFSDNFNYSVLQKANHEDYIPDFYDNKDIITLLYSIRNNFSFKSKNRIWQIDYLYEENNSKLLLINGFDYKSARKNSILLKKKLFKIINLSNIASYSSSTYNSEFYSWKNYIIDSKSDELNFQIQSGISSSLKLSYKYTIKNNTLGNELADIKEFKLENNQIIFTKGNLQSNLSFVNIDFNVETISTVSYEMLDGLKKGKNIIWSLTYNQKLSKIFQLSLNYNGRTSENNPIIHNGGVQLSANF
ncbi:MAG: hypothetical protein JXA16_03250, partial [Bacteroidales bacterium]|nr:hypothetical protein [Bacteroidales bacterium]